MTSHPPSSSEIEASDGQVIRRLLTLTWSYRVEFLHVVAFQIALLVLVLAGLGLTGVGIDYVRFVVQPGAPAPHWPFGLAPPVDWKPLSVLAVIGLAVFLIASVRAGLTYLAQASLNLLTQGRIVVDLRPRVYDKLQRLSFRFFDANASSSIINRVTGDVQSVRMFVDQVLMQAIIVVVSLAVYTAYMLSVSIKLTVACLAVTPLIWLCSASFARAVHPAYRRNRELVDQLVQRLVEGIRGMAVIKAYGCETDEIRRFQKANDIVRDQQHGIFLRLAAFHPGIGYLSQLTLVVLLGYGGYLAAKGAIPIGTGLVVFAAILQQLAAQISSIANIANSMHQSLRGARRVFDILDVPVEIQSPRAPVRPAAIEGRVRFEHVWFDHGENPVLQDIDFAVEPGQCVAIVGPTGSGKSSVLGLLPRFYDPTGGRILFDGMDLRDFDVDDLRRRIGIVFQESFLFSTTVAENIAFGHPEASRELIEKAARIAAAHDFICDLPKGYDTVLGEAGVGLSGGQKQRMAIARAVLLDPPILVLDDPTAAVDPGTEHEIAAAIETAMAGRTTFLVAHRPAMLRRADLVIVLDHGRIAQTGTHDDLMAREGYYLDALEIQNPRPADRLLP
ncbi:MAG: ABC transporter ATP-binding protein [Verrucomicrobiota bacterium]